MQSVFSDNRLHNSHTLWLKSIIKKREMRPNKDQCMELKDVGPNLSHTYVLLAVFWASRRTFTAYIIDVYNRTESQKPAGFRYPRGCHWDSCSYKLNRCYWSPLRASLFSHCLFPPLFSSLPIIRMHHPYRWFLSSDTSDMSHPTPIDPKHTWTGRQILVNWTSCSTDP